MKTGLVVDDSMYMRIPVKMTLTDAGYEIAGEAADDEEAFKEGDSEQACSQ